MPRRAVLTQLPGGPLVKVPSPSAPYKFKKKQEWQDVVALKTMAGSKRRGFEKIMNQAATINLHKKHGLTPPKYKTPKKKSPKTDKVVILQRLGLDESPKKKKKKKSDKSPKKVKASKKSKKSKKKKKKSIYTPSDIAEKCEKARQCIQKQNTAFARKKERDRNSVTHSAVAECAPTHTGRFYKSSEKRKSFINLVRKRSSSKK